MALLKRLSLGHMVFLKLLLGQPNVEIIFVLCQIGLGDVHLVASVDDSVYIITSKGLFVSKVIPKELSNLNHAIHLEDSFLHEVVQQRYANSKDERPTVDQEQVKDVEKNLFGKEASE